VLLDADPVRIIQILTNLLNNAVKYTEPGGQIWLTAAVEEETLEAADSSFAPRPAVRISIRDTGRGIAAELLPRIFDLFVQGERTLARTEGGLGIGLTLVKRLVEMHGGTITARSDGPGHGSEFTLRLPVIRAKDEGQRASPQAQPADPILRPSHVEPCPSPRRVLVVEDNVDAADTLAELLETWGHDVCVVHSGRAALEMTPAYAPHVILLDIGLPEMDGYEVAQRLLAGKVPAPSPEKYPRLIALTGYGQEEHCQRSRTAGFDHHLTKPIDAEVLRGLIDRLGAS
jgi:CheY-like chemotaxis protein